jgi:putative oxidoreductase
MTDLNSSQGRWSQCMLSVLRIISALLFMQHGAQKLFGFLAPMHATSHRFFSMMGIAGILEFFGGLLVVLGVFTRPVAFVLSGEMAVAYLMVHAPKGFWPLQNGGDLAVLWSLVFFYMAVAGGGAWRLDRLWSGNRG